MEKEVNKPINIPNKTRITCSHTRQSKGEIAPSCPLIIVEIVLIYWLGDPRTEVLLISAAVFISTRKIPLWLLQRNIPIVENSILND